MDFVVSIGLAYKKFGWSKHEKHRTGAGPSESRYKTIVDIIDKVKHN